MARARDSVTRTSDPDSASEAFATALRRVIRPLDLLAVLSVPALLVAVSTLPPDRAAAFAFAYADPTPLTAVTANFVHAGPAHLAWNLASYTLAAGTVYGLAALADRRGLFYTAFGAILLAFPLVLSVSNLAVPREGVFVGASGLAMAFVGVLPVAFGGYLRRRFGVAAASEVAGLLFLVGLTLTALFALPDGGDLLAAVAALGALGYAVSLSRNGLAPGTFAAPRAGFLEFGLWSVGLFVALLVSAFPADPAADGAIVNTYVHFLGYALGFLSSYLTVLVAAAEGEGRGI